jgi:hypothetical protein
MMNEIIFLLLVFGLPAAIGYKLALSRGKNPILWGLLCIFPFFLIVLHFEKPKHEITGHFRRCAQCGEIYRWKDPVCKYCGFSASDSKNT